MSTQPPAPRRRLTLHDLRAMKRAGEKIAMVTAYDATMARLVDEAGVDAILVGDSLGMVVQGHDSTLPVKLEHMAYHTACVRRGLARSGGRAHLTADLPFGSYQAGLDDAVRAAVLLLAEGGADAVKLEGGAAFADAVRRIVRAGVPVMGHIGLTPQSVHALGGYRVQGRDAEDAQPAPARRPGPRGRRAASRSSWSACPAELARIVTGQVGIPTIGIGAGPSCDGQVLVVNDLLGLDAGFSPEVREALRRAGGAGR